MATKTKSKASTIVLRGNTKADVEASIRTFEREMRGATLDAVREMRNAIRYDRVNIENFIEALTDFVSEIAESFAVEIEDDLDRAIEAGETKRTR